MNKFLLSAALSLGLALTSQQEAKAWINAKFSIGMNLHWQSGGNQFLWGLWSNGQPPDPFQIGPPPGFHGGPRSDFPFFGQQPQNNQMQPVPAPATAGQQQANWLGSPNPYMPVNYYSGNYFAPAGPYTPGYYGYFQAPPYWYGR